MLALKEMLPGRERAGCGGEERSFGRSVVDVDVPVVGVVR